jgi:autophagy-related protein 17
MPENPLLQWTVDAKRALHHAEQLSLHANKLVDGTSAVLDTAETLIPKGTFLKDALKAQVALLEQVGAGCYAVEERSRLEFEVFYLIILDVTDGEILIKELDNLDLQLNDILAHLKSAPLDPGFDAVNEPELQHDPPRKTLHDFVDEQGIEGLKAQLRQAIDEVQVYSLIDPTNNLQESHEYLSSSLANLSAEIKELRILVETIQLPTILPPLSPSTESPKPSETQLYTTYREKQAYHAQQLASLLFELMEHFDQTSSALKQYDSPLGRAPNIDPEHLEILSRDASQVHDVLEIMEGHVGEIEHCSQVLQSHVDFIEDTYTGITNTFAQIEEYGKLRLPGHLATVKEFELQVVSHKEHIQTLKQELFNLVEYYTKFSTAYTALLDEVRRRASAQILAANYVNTVVAELNNLYQQEVTARREFMNLHADYLPVDLWRGMYDSPPRSIVHTEKGGVLPILRDQMKRRGSAGMERRRSGQPALSGSSESAGRRSLDSSGRRSGENSARR